MKIQRIDRGTVPNLPDEIIWDILSWLPVASLLKFKCVCRSWCFLISSQSFIEYHLKVYGRNDNKRIIFNDFVSNRTILHCSFNSLLPGSVVKSANFGFPIKIRGPKLIVGSVDGLLCILVNLYYFYLWNPSTRKFRVLPQVNNKLSLKYCGFGFDESNRDYKLVTAYDKIMKVYSLKSNSWKSFSTEGYAGNYLPTLVGKFADGKLHWGYTERSRGECDRIGILSFDLTKEVWEKMYVPNYCLEEFMSCVGVGVGFASHLSVQCANLEGIGIGMDVYKCRRPNVAHPVWSVGPNDIILFMQKKSSRYVVKGNFSKDGGRMMINADDHSKKAYIADRNIREAWIVRESLVEII